MKLKGHKKVLDSLWRYIVHGLIYTCGHLLKLPYVRSQGLFVSITYKVSTDTSFEL